MTFIEVYQIPVVDYSKDVKSSITNTNRRAINIADISRIQPDTNDRAEVVLRSDGTRYHTVGSYDEILERLKYITKVNRIP